MNTCKARRKLIVELALETLEPAEERALRAHLETCSGCREYLAEVSQLATTLQSAHKGSDIEATEAFHQSVIRAVRNARASSTREAIANALRVRPVSWRWAASGLGALGFVIVLGLVLLSRPSERRQASTPSRAPVYQELDSELPPSVANYRIAANHSLDQLDELLTRQANRRVPTKPIYPASILAVNSRLSD